MLKLRAKLTDRPNLGRIGLITVALDETGDRAFRSIVEPRGVDVFSTRTQYFDDEPDENGEFQLKTPFDEIAKTFPDADRLDILAFSCTSGTVATGKEKMLEILEAAKPGLKYTTPGVAALNALEHMGISRIALLTPYDGHMHSLFIPFFEENGIKVPTHGTFDVDESDIHRIAQSSILEGAKQILQGHEVEAIYLSCTALNATQYIDFFEYELGLPVFTSPQVFAWDCLRLLGQNLKVPGYGKLFDAQPANVL